MQHGKNSKQETPENNRKAETAPTNRWRGELQGITSLQTNSRLFLAVFGIALTSSQAPFQLLRHVLIAVLAHWPQVNFNKLISELRQTQQVKHVKREIGGKQERRGRKGKRAREREELWEESEIHLHKC